MKEDLIRWLNPLNAEVHISSGEEDELIEGDIDGSPLAFMRLSNGFLLGSGRVAPKPESVRHRKGERGTPSLDGVPRSETTQNLGVLFCRLRCETSKRYHEENVVKTALLMLSVSLFFVESLFTVFGKNTRRVFA
jgi:hypothetical protein